MVTTQAYAIVASLGRRRWKISACNSLEHIRPGSPSLFNGASTEVTIAQLSLRLLRLSPRALLYSRLRVLPRRGGPDWVVVVEDGAIPPNCLRVSIYWASWRRRIKRRAVQYICILSRSIKDNPSTKIDLGHWSVDASPHLKALAFSVSQNCITLQLFSYSNESISDVALAVTLSTTYNFSG